MTMDLLTIGFSFGLGVCIGNNTIRHKLQQMIHEMNKPKKKEEVKN